MPKDLKYGRVTLEHSTIGEDEPVVVFRAQDDLLPAVLEHYRLLCEQNGSPRRHLGGIDAAREQVEAWQRDHYTQVPQSAAPADGWRDGADDA
ncbi:MAG: hypothetical protein JWO57_793 [Pseudonocardiales bacterium]|nr:hypothetical protein [Pseudonocardiales bacterium]